MVKCSYCGAEVEKGTGKIIVDKASKQLNICSSKCEKNWKLGRKSRTLSWIKKMVNKK